MGAKKINPPTIIKKIKPYPIVATILKGETPQPLQGQIVRLTTLGFQITVTGTYFNIGDIYQVDFELPLYKYKISETVKVIKTVDRFKDDKATIKEYLVEMHFISLNIMNTKAIKKFESDIGSTKK